MAELIEQLVTRESTSCTSPGVREGYDKPLEMGTNIIKGSFIQSSDHDAIVHVYNSL